MKHTEEVCVPEMVSILHELMQSHSMLISRSRTSFPLPKYHPFKTHVIAFDHRKGPVVVQSPQAASCPPDFFSVDLG